MKEDQLQQVNASITRMKALAAKKEAAQDLQLPLWPESKRGTPNSFLRSALFSAIQSKDRRRLDGEVLGSLNGITVRFTGQQFNQEDLTLWETIVHLARTYHLGYECSFTAYGILQAMDLATGGDDYERLHQGILRLTAGMVEIESENGMFAGHMIESSVKEYATARYAIRLNRDMLRLYNESNWTAIDWQQRQGLRRRPLAQALHGFYSTHKEPYPLKIETLYKITGSQNKRPSSFKQQLIAALEELVSVDFLVCYKLENDTVIVSRNYRGSTV